jgi:hypothetical protein
LRLVTKESPLPGQRGLSTIQARRATDAREGGGDMATTAKKGDPKAAPKDRIVNKGKTCSVKGCTHPASRRGMCSGKGTSNHYRRALRAAREAS